jgi:hypothetical protein
VVVHEIEAGQPGVPQDSFQQGQPVVGTTYFYRRDVEKKVHIIDRDGSDALTTHPADPERISDRRTARGTER